MAIIIILLLIILSKVDVNSYTVCPEHEKQSLLFFKNDLIDSTNRLASWDPNLHQDCCRWFGVVCDNRTGHVISLDLGVPIPDEDTDYQSYRMSMLKGKINPSLSNLKQLKYLDLSRNSFEGILPYQLGNLSNLEYLNLGDNPGYDSLYVENLNWLSRLSLLKHLDISYNNFDTSIPQWLYSFSSLQVLKLDGNRLQGGISSSIGNMISLNELDLSLNLLDGKLPKAMGGLCNLRSIDLSKMKLMSHDISDIFGVLSGCCSHVLESLWLDNCQLSGQLPDELGHFKNLKELSLSHNSISGPIPTSLGKLANLESVSIENNLLEGVVSGKHFANHTKLRIFRGSENSLVLRVNPAWVPPFQLRYLYLRSWQIGPSFPLWLHSQKHLDSLDISNSRISDTIPSWFWSLSTQISYLNLSTNQISGSLNFVDGLILDLSFNNFSGPLPQFSGSSNWYMNLSNNYFSGSLFHFCAIG